jgi:glycosyltransferase involved in cell wall biosynthesis
LLSDALKQLILDKNLGEEMGRKGLMVIAEKYSWMKATKDYDAICQTHDRDS